MTPRMDAFRQAFQDLCRTHQCLVVSEAPLVVRFYNAPVPPTPSGRPCDLALEDPLDEVHLEEDQL